MVLIEAGAYQPIVDGLSSRLNMHEPTIPGRTIKPARRMIASGGNHSMCPDPVDLLTDPEMVPEKTRTHRRAKRREAGGTCGQPGQRLFTCNCGGQMSLRLCDLQ